MDDRPNVLFIFTDQQTLRAMSAYGNADLHTPHMDAIADSGVRFDRSYCASPVCGPARAALITGRMPHELGTDVNGIGLPPTCRTLGHLFREAGYESAYVGKWHLPQSFIWDADTDAHGFRFLTFPRPEHPQLGVATDGPTAEAAAAFLRERRRHDRPFLLTVSLHNPHDICHAVSQGRIEPRSAEAGPELPENFPRDPDEPAFITDCRQRRHYGNEQNQTGWWSTSHWRGYLHHYYRLVETVDAQVGRIMQALRESGLAHDTLVVFTSDHGEGVAAHQWVVKLMLYEEPVTVPLVLSWPGVIGEGRVDRTHLASAIDLLPTMCDYAGIAVDASVSGVSLRRVIEQPDRPGRPYVVAELQPDTHDSAKLGRMLRTPRYKYVAFSYGRHPEMLFDVISDPGELRNLARLPEAEPILREHRQRLKEWIAERGDHFPSTQIES